MAHLFLSVIASGLCEAIPYPFSPSSNIGCNSVSQRSLQLWDGFGAKCLPWNGLCSTGAPPRGVCTPVYFPGERSLRVGFRTHQNPSILRNICNTSVIPSAQPSSPSAIMISSSIPLSVIASGLLALELSLLHGCEAQRP